jgi:hypothetical protein
VNEQLSAIEAQCEVAKMAKEAKMKMPKKRSSSASGSYEIGYGRPPQQYQFRHGRTANPAGINQHTSRSIARDMKLALERELNKKVKVRQGKRSITVRQTMAGISKLVCQFVEGSPRARRDLILLCEKLGVELVNRNALQGALEEALSAEDEALLAEFVKRHGGQYRLQADAFLTNPTNTKLLTSPNKDAKLLGASSENLLESQIHQTEEKVS